MVSARCFVLQVLLLCCSNIRASRDKNTWFSKVLAGRVSEKGPSHAGDAPPNIRDAHFKAAAAKFNADAAVFNAEAAVFNAEAEAFNAEAAAINAEAATFNVEAETYNTEDETSDAVNATFDAVVNMTAKLHECETRFLSIAMDSKRVNADWNDMRLGSAKFTNIVKALAPSDFRLGGTSADFLVFQPDGSLECQSDEEEASLDEYDEFDSGHFDTPEAIPYFYMTGRRWQSFNAFLSRAGWDLMFDVNLFFWTDDRHWNSSNAWQLLNYSSAHGIPIPYFQLGNEPNAFPGNFGFWIAPEVLSDDFAILKNLTSSFPMYAQSKLYGPDVANVFGDVSDASDSHSYFQGFVKGGAYNVVSGYSLHHYYFNGKSAKLAMYISPDVMGGLKMSLQSSIKVANASPRPHPIMLTETADSYGGGAAYFSDTYVDGFLWLDKLGVSAQLGVIRVFRQALFGANYALLASNLTPHPDYYTSVIFKRLIEGPVFNVTTQPSIKHLRIYAHCARRGIYNPGDLVIYYLNLNNATINISLSQFPNADLDLYLLTPGDDVRGLQSWSIKLNGVVLKIDGNLVPPMPPKPHKGEVTVGALTYGFIVVRKANVTLCLDYYNKIDSQEMTKSE